MKLIVLSKSPKRYSSIKLSNYGKIYIISENFDYLETQTEGSGGEIQLTDAIERLNKNDKVYAFDFEGQRYDVGEKQVL